MKVFNNIPRFDKIQYVLNSDSRNFELQTKISKQGIKNLFPMHLQRSKTWSKKIRVNECLQLPDKSMFTGLVPTKYKEYFIGNIREQINGNLKQSILIIEFKEMALNGKFCHQMNIYYFMGFNKISHILRQEFTHLFIQHLKHTNTD